MKKIFTALCLVAFLSACSSLYRNPEQEKVQAEADEAYRKSVSIWKEKHKNRPVQVKTTENVEVLPLIKGRVSKFKTPKPNPTVAEIEEELHHNIDKHSRNILTSNIEVLLNHCLRFYDRQFTTREAINHDALSRFENLMSEYFDSDKPANIGLPTVAWCAEQLHFSANYFGDLIKKETGKSAIEYIHLSIIDHVKELLAGTNKTVSEIAYEVGFQYPHHLSRMFKKTVGYTPNEYRKAYSA